MEEVRVRAARLATHPGGCGDVEAVCALRRTRRTGTVITIFRARCRERFGFASGVSRSRTAVAVVVAVATGLGGPLSKTIEMFEFRRGFPVLKKFERSTRGCSLRKVREKLVRAFV